MRRELGAGRELDALHVEAGFRRIAEYGRELRRAGQALENHLAGQLDLAEFGVLLERLREGRRKDESQRGRAGENHFCCKPIYHNSFRRYEERRRPPRLANFVFTLAPRNFYPPSS